MIYYGSKPATSYNVYHGRQARHSLCFCLMKDLMISCRSPSSKAPWSCSYFVFSALLHHEHLRCRQIRQGVDPGSPPSMDVGDWIAGLRRFNRCSMPTRIHCNASSFLRRVPANGGAPRSREIGRRLDICCVRQTQSYLRVLSSKPKTLQV